MMVYVCIDGCNVDGHAIAFVEFAGVLLQLFCATMRATSTYQAYRWLLQKAANAAVICRRRCCNLQLLQRRIKNGILWVS